MSEPPLRVARNTRILFALGGISTAIFLRFFVLLLKERADRGRL